MSNAIRKIERQAILRRERSKNGNGNNFAEAWKLYRESKYVIKDEEGNVIQDNTPRNTMHKKQIHFDTMEQYANMWAWANEQEEKREESNEK